LGNLPPSALLSLGGALVLLLASIGLIMFTLSARRGAAPAAAATTPTPTAFVALVETPQPTPTTDQPADTPTATAAVAATARRSTPRPTGTPAPLGSAQSRAVDGLTGAMLAATGGATLPPPPTPTPAAVAAAPTKAPPTPAPAPRAANPPVAANPPAPANAGTGGPPPAAPPAEPTATPIPPTPVPPTATPIPPTPTAIPTPVVPAVALPTPGSRPYRYALTYTQSANLAGAPVSTNAYAVTWPDYTSADVAALAQSLGLHGAVTAQGGGYRVSAPEGTLTVVDGLITYTAGGQASSQAPAGPLSDDAARTAARRWLAARGLLPSGADNGTVTHPNPGQTLVSFELQSLTGPVLGDVGIAVALDDSGTVRAAGYRWPASATPQPVALRSAASAWADVQAGKGYVVVDWTMPWQISQGTVYTGAATVTQVTVGWAVAAAPDGTPYLVPVFVFQGQATLDGQQQPAPFRVFVPAVSGQ
jgi:hypothetical protein